MAAKILSLHKYDVPEIIACEVTMANKPYYDWVVETVQDKKSPETTQVKSV